MSVRELQTLHAWASEQAKEPANPAGERRLWRTIAREVETYQRGTVLSTPSGAPLCSICREANGRHRSLATGQYVTKHDTTEGLLW